MSFIAVIGAGELGGAVAERLARRDCAARVLLVDREHGVAAGKALDIRQSGPVAGFHTALDAAGDPEAARGAGVAVIAAPAGDAEASVELVTRLATADGPTVVVLADAAPVAAMERALGERRVPRRRLVGSAPLAFASAVRALVAASADCSPSEIALTVAGRPPELVVLWSGATINGSPVEEAVSPSVLAGVRRRVPALWPPGPLALASAAARVAEAVAVGSRRQFPCWVGLEGPPAGLGRVAAMPVQLGPHGIVRMVPPVMSARERVLVGNALERRP